MQIVMQLTTSAAIDGAPQSIPPPLGCHLPKVDRRFVHLARLVWLSVRITGQIQHARVCSVFHFVGFSFSFSFCVDDFILRL